MTIDASLAERVTAGFLESYGRAPDLIAYAPGRVNLIGEHTDYNDGFVLPCAIPYGTAIAIGRNANSRINAVALDFADSSDHFKIDDNIAPLDASHWANHIRGIAAGLRAFGLPCSGADLAIAGNVPQGAGLSSSASLGLSLAMGLSAISGDAAPDRTQMAKIAQWSEHNFAGCQCGIMDQLASAYGEKGFALLIDCRSTSCRTVAMPADAQIMIVHSGIQRGLVDSEYNDRRAQCMAAAQHYGVPALRDIDEAVLVEQKSGLDEIVFRRARHVVTENARTIALADALADSDYGAISQLMAASHQSMRDDFAITLPAIDALVARMAGAIGREGGVRMTGGGFGGCVVAIVAQSAQKRLERALAAHWSEVGGSSPLQTVVVPAQGAFTILIQATKP